MKKLLTLFLLLGRSVMAVDLKEHAAAHPSGAAAYSFDMAAYREDTRHLPIGVFDSGIGGLTVLEAILSLDVFHNDSLKPGADGKPDFAGERFIYFGDQANMPYGNYSAAGRTDFLRELILRGNTVLTREELKERYTGVSATINALVPLQAHQWRLGFCGTRMSNGIDGMTLDVDGNIVATAGWEVAGAGPMIYVFSPTGRVLETHPVPAIRPTNCCFGGPDMKTLFVTTTQGHFFRAETDRTGWAMYP